MSAPLASSSEGDPQPSPSAPSAPFNTAPSPSAQPVPPLPPSTALAPAPAPAPSDPVPFLTGLLSRPVRLALRDHRTLRGLVASIDSTSLILTYTEEFPAPSPPLSEQSPHERAVRESVGRYWPRSEGFGGPPGTGWGGRGLGMVLVKLSDVDRVELMDEEEGEGGAGAEGGAAEGASTKVDGKTRGEGGKGGEEMRPRETEGREVRTSGTRRRWT